MSKIKIGFCDFWPGFEKDNFILKVLEKRFDVGIHPDPDYVFFSVYGNEHLRYPNAVRICYTGENVLPDFNLCDYGIGFHHLDFGDRYLRFPLYLIYPGYDSLREAKVFDGERMMKRKFCNFLYSNSHLADPIRGEFFKRLSRYKRVDSGGKHLNNMGYTVGDKLSFVSEYKFTIAFENSSLDGYTTEKIMEPMRVNSIPIYWGNPRVEIDFNEASFLNCMRFSSIANMVDEVVAMDQDQQRYINMLHEPWLNRSQASMDWQSALYEFLNSIFSQQPEKAYRYPRFGFNKFLMGQLEASIRLVQKQKRVNEIKNRLRSFIWWKDRNHR